MCRSKYHRNRGSIRSKSPEETRSSFYKNLLAYLVVIGFIFYTSPDSGSWKFIAIFWGISLLSLYKRSKWALGSRELSRAKVQNEEYVDDIVPPPPAPNWKDRDLV